MGFDCELKEVLKFTYHVALDHGIGEDEFDHVFIGTFDGEVQPNPDEAGSFKWVDTDRLSRDVEEHPEQYTEWFKIALEKVLSGS